MTSEQQVSDLLTTSAGYVSTFPAPGLRRTVRHITGHNAEGKGIFLSTDDGAHHRVIGNEQAIANILYSTNETPAELNNDVDLKYAKETEVSESSASKPDLTSCQFTNTTISHSLACTSTTAQSAA
jgi:hypothetical protein